MKLLLITLLFGGTLAVLAHPETELHQHDAEEEQVLTLDH